MPGQDVLMACGKPAHIRGEANTVITNYVSTMDAESWAEIGPFVCDIVGVASPRTVYAATLLMSPTAQYVLWCRRSVGLPLNARVLFRRVTIELYVRQNADRLAEGTLRKYRSMLLRIAEVLLPEDNPSPMRPLNNKSPYAPYDSTDLARFRDWAGAQSTQLKRRKAAVILCLCAGAGMKSGEITRLARNAITIDESGILVHVRGKRARDIPLLCEWEPLLRHTLSGIDDADLVFGLPPRQRHTLSAFIENTAGPHRPRSDRLRATWLVTHLSAETPMKAFMIAAGIHKLEAMSAYLEFVPALDTHGYRRSLRLAPSLD